VLGDVDGDGVPDVYASDWGNNANGPHTGRVYIHSGKDGHRLFAFTGETAGEGFGTSPSVAGDVDGDGHADAIVGAWQYSGAAIGGGRAYLYSGKDGRLMRTYTCRTPGDTFGFDAMGAPPPNTQAVFGQAAACQIGYSGEPGPALGTIPGTACIEFNSRGIAIDAAGAPNGSGAFYVNNGNMVYGLTMAAAGPPLNWSGYDRANSTWYNQ